MEDRQPPRLHVELVRTPDTVTARAEAVAAAGWRTSTWEPCEQPIEFARQEGPCAGVVIGEGDGRPVPVAAEATTTVSLRRYPRPSQGSCSGEQTTGILLVLISPRDADAAQALRDWGDFIHLRHIAEAGVPGYRTIAAWENEHLTGPRFCHLYEMTGDDPQATFERMTPLVRGRLDPSTFRSWAWHPQLVIEESRTYRRTS
ncbi:hypothetical protein I6A60_10600 [Frankia sp. AgB1.9]|uniref:hypothetical protein n=1 Tax=unclassified Frankia TaxID=2632575 RepID=UPI001933ED92|nr:MULTISPECIES: hypothetical protein [unclassified Frankia]MBL7488094.1 hypothetical protein [Frankia sp. AgW1.1]MBL7548321.1 hypothetical protein [Frankia sp. AgB1.9]MBL7625235.1 hypothetical protein [Frankia sp. AgB1.8]